LPGFIPEERFIHDKSQIYFKNQLIVSAASSCYFIGEGVIFITGSSGDCSDILLSFLNSLPQRAMLMGKDGKIIQANKSVREWIEENDLSAGGKYKDLYFSDFLRRAGGNPDKIEVIEKKTQRLFENRQKSFAEEILLQTDQIDIWLRIDARRYEEHIIILKEDITEKKQLEKEIKEKNNLLEEVLNGFPDIIGVQKPDHTILHYNEAGYDMLGMDPEEVKGQKCFRLLGRKKECENCASKKAINSRKLAETEKYIPEMDTYLNCRSNPVINEEGEVELVVEQLRDITEQKMDRLKSYALFENSTSAIAMLDSEGNIDDINNKFSEVFGYELSEVKGKNLDEILAGDSSGVCDSNKTDKLQQGKTLKGEGTRYDKAGNPGEFIYHAIPILVNEEIVGFYVIYDDITELKREKEKLEETKEELENTKNELEAILGSIQEGISLLDTDLKVRYTNDTMREWYEDNIPLESNKCYRVYRNRNEPCSDCPALRCMESGQVEKEVVSASEHPGDKYLEVFAYPMIDEITGDITGVVEFVRDVTERKKLEEELKIREEQYRKIFETAPVGIMLEDKEGNILEANSSLCEITGYQEEELLGKKVVDTLPPPEHKEEALKNIDRILNGEDIEFTTEGCKKSGERYYLHIFETSVSLPNGEKGILSIQMDMTDMKEKEEKLEYLSYHDSLTDLYNRTFIEEEMKRLNTERQHPISFIYADINGLKLVNDTYGHDKGDELLIKAAEILRDNTRAEDIVARWAGDEFVILLPQTTPEAAGKISRRIENACDCEMIEDIPISLGIGAATKTDTKEKFEDTLKKADEKMYKDKLTKANSTENRLIENMLNTLAAKSQETKEHAQRMSELAQKLGDEMGLSNEQINNLSLLASLHDIGKTTISQDILTRPGDLTEEEWNKIKEHPERGYNIAASTEEFSHIARAILHHHERWDGRGYPQEIEKEEIPLLARIISIVDAYDVMTAGKTYKDAMSKKEALEEIKRCAGSQFDPELAAKFVEIME